MENILTIDNGNTHPNVGIFGNGVLRDICPLVPFLEGKNLGEFNIIMAEMGQKIDVLDRHPRLTRVRDLRRGNMFFEMSINYSSSLGEDRLAASYYIYRERIVKGNYDQAILIDAGTFITIDLINTKGYQGGSILPGPQLFLDIYNKGHKLSGLHEWPKDENPPDPLPHNTVDAISNSCKFYLLGTLREILKGFDSIPHLSVTGGQGLFLTPHLNEILPTALIHWEPHLLHKALYALSPSERPITDLSPLG